MNRSKSSQVINKGEDKSRERNCFQSEPLQKNKERQKRRGKKTKQEKQKDGHLNFRNNY